MTNALTRQPAIRMLPPRPTPEQLVRRQARRRKAIRNTILEALATIGLGTCFILCAVMLICVV
ncbi:MAG: hypothetical protein IKQ54_10920 [Oscillospiraceae bacterium]|nr:hypothetical protein [Oscillospiraceae bacterium]